MAYLALGELERSTELIESARRVYLKAGMIAEGASCTIALASVQIALGNHRHAAKILASVPDSFEDHIVPFSVARQLMAFGEGVMNLGLQRDAIRICAHSRESFARSGSDLDVAFCDLLLGRAFLEAGGAQQAVEFIDRARNIGSSDKCVRGQM